MQRPVLKSLSFRPDRSGSLLCLCVLLASGCVDNTPRTGSAVTTANPCATTKRPGEARDLDVARCLSDSPLSKPRVAQLRPVALYLDHSASIQGFLDPAYPTRIPTDYRSVIDKLIVGLKPAKAYGFGEALRPIQPDLGTVGNKAFYNDRDTHMEDAFAVIAKDSELNSSHVIVGDGRRGNPNDANSQFSRMRDLAQQWVGRSGTFAVAASLAPFKTVESDPSGCRRDASVDKASTGQTCPLYAFAFIAPGEEMRVLGALASVFEHLYAWPEPPVRPELMTVDRVTSPELEINPQWARASDGAFIVRTRGPNATNHTALTGVRLADTATSDGHTLTKLLDGQSMQLDLAARSLDVSSKAREWLPLGASGSAIRASTDRRLGLIVTSFGNNAPTSIVRVDLVGRGDPTWLSAFDAVDATDVIRTFGIGRLFESFRQQASSAPLPFTHLYFVVN